MGSPEFCDKRLNYRFSPSMHVERDSAFFNSIRCTHLIKNLNNNKKTRYYMQACAMFLK